MKISLSNIELLNFDHFTQSYLIPICLHYFQSPCEIKLLSLQSNDEILLTNSMIGIIRNKLKLIPVYNGKEIIITSMEGKKYKIKCILPELPTNIILPQSLPTYLNLLSKKYQIISSNTKISIIPYQNPPTPSLSNNNIFFIPIYEIMSNISKTLNNNNICKCILIKDYPGNCTSSQISRYCVEHSKYNYYNY